MKRIFSVFSFFPVVAIALTLLMSLTFSQPAFAEVSEAAKIFNNNCAQCHAGGANKLSPQKTLKKVDLQKYGMYSGEAIISQVTNGKGAMPAFSKRLKPNQIELVAAYVLEQADNGWAK